MAGLLAWPVVEHLPVDLINSGMQFQLESGEWLVASGNPTSYLPTPTRGFTATGIAPDLHRTSLLIPVIKPGTKSMQM